MAIQIKKASEIARERTLNMLVYGEPGSGKTTFCASSKNPLYIDIEGGTIGISNKDIDVVRAKTVAEVKEAVQYAINNGYDTVCFDSLTRYAEMLIDDIIKEDKKSKAQIQHWGELVNQIKKMIWYLQQAEISSIFVCLEKEVDDDGMVIKRPSLNGQLTQSIPGIVDVVGYLHTNQQGGVLLGLNPTSKYYAKHRAPLQHKIKEVVNVTFDDATGELGFTFEDLKDRIYGKETSCEPNLPAA